MVGVRWRTTRFAQTRSIGGGGFGALLMVLGLLLAGPPPGAPSSPSRAPPPPTAEVRPDPAPGSAPWPLSGAPSEAQGLSVTIEAPSSTDDAGVEVPLWANVSGGTPPYQVTWNDSAGASAIGLTWSVRSPVPGTLTVQATVTDAPGDVAGSTLRLAFVPGPALALAASAPSVDEGVPFALEISTAGGVPPLTLTWSLVPGPLNGTSVPGADGTATVPVTVDAAGDVAASVELVDSTGDRTAASAVVAVSYAPPTLQIGPVPMFADANAPFALEGHVVGGAPPEGWAVLPSVPAAVPGGPTGAVAPNGSFQWSGVFDAPGNSTLSVTVTDADGETVSSTAPVEVFSALAVAMVPPPGAVLPGASLAATAAVSGGYPPYRWTITVDGAPGPSGTLDAPGNVSFQLPVGDVPAISVGISVTDAVGGATAGDWQFTVQPPGPPAPGTPAPTAPPSLLGEAATPAAIALTVLTLLALVVPRYRRRTRAPAAALRVIEEQLRSGTPVDAETLEQRGRESDVSERAMRREIARLLSEGRLRKVEGPLGEEHLERVPPAAPPSLEDDL